MAVYVADALPATSTSQPGFVRVTWPTGLPLGTDTCAVFTTAPNAFAGVNGPGDITAFVTDQLQSL